MRLGTVAKLLVSRYVCKSSSELVLTVSGTNSETAQSLMSHTCALTLLTKVTNSYTGRNLLSILPPMPTKAAGKATQIKHSPKLPLKLVHKSTALILFQTLIFW